MSWNYVFFFEIIYFFNVCECFGGLFVCAQHVCLVPEEVRRRHHISGTGVNELLWATVWVPRVKFRSSERQQVPLPACWDYTLYESLLHFPTPLLMWTLPPALTDISNLEPCFFARLLFQIFPHDMKVAVTQSRQSSLWACPSFLCSPPHHCLVSLNQWEFAGYIYFDEVLLISSCRWSECFFCSHWV